MRPAKWELKWDLGCPFLYLIFRSHCFNSKAGLDDSSKTELAREKSLQFNASYGLPVIQLRPLDRPHSVGTHGGCEVSGPKVAEFLDR